MLATLRQLVDKAAADATDQAVLRRLDAALVRADRWVKTYCRWAIEAGDFTEYHGGGQQEIILKQMRVTSLSGVTVDDPGISYGVWYDPDRLWPDSSLLVAGTDYRLEDGGANGILRRLPGGWCCSGWRGGFESLRVRFRAGYEEDEIPDDLAGAVLDVARQMYLSDLASQRVSGSGSGGTGGAIKSVRRGQSQITYMTAAESTAVATRTTSTGGTNKAPADPYGVNATLDLYRDWRAG